MRSLSIGTPDQQRDWMMARLQPYRVEPVAGATDGLLTSYYEPVLDASRQPHTSFAVPLYRPPAGLVPRRPWYTRQQMETLPEARAALAGHEIAWLSDPLDALVLQIQGSGRVRITEADGSQETGAARLCRHQRSTVHERGPLDARSRRDPGCDMARHQGLGCCATRSARRKCCGPIRAWVFFREEPLPPQDAAFGPKGAQGVALTPGRSIAVDPKKHPVRHPGLARLIRPDRESAKTRARAGHRQRDHRAGARRLLRGLGARRRRILRDGSSSR